MSKIEPQIPDDVLKIIYGDTQDIEQNPDLVHGVEIDKAHLLMLAKQGIVDKDATAQLLKAIVELQNSDFEALKDKPLKRGWYIAYENFLNEKLGKDIGGRLHTGRSRNDLFATVFRLQTRALFIDLVSDILGVNSALFDLAKKYVETPAIIHTQMQPAMFGTFGHVFAGIGEALNVQSEEILSSLKLNDHSPLGSGAATGTSFEIDPEYVTALLGFSDITTNSLRGVAHYEYTINIASSIIAYGGVINRLASQLHLWSTREFNVIKFKDGFVGASSMLPQKRNPFLLEVLKSKLNEMNMYLGPMISGMQNTPFSNGMESKAAAKNLWSLLACFKQVLTLTKLILENIEVVEDSALDGARYSDCFALYLAEEKVRTDGVSFRQAYEDIAVELSKQGVVDGLNVGTVIEKFKYGAGPSPDVTQKTINTEKAKIQQQQKNWSAQTDTWLAAHKKLNNEVESLIS